MTAAAVVESLARRRLLTSAEKRAERVASCERIARRQRAQGRYLAAAETERITDLILRAIESAERAS